MSDYKDLRKMIGKRIVAFEYPRRWDEYALTWIHSPKITLEDGSVLWFTAEEGSSEHGIAVSIFNPKSKKP